MIRWAMSVWPLKGPDASPLTGRRVLGLFLVFFLTIFAVNGAMVYLAITTFSGLDTEDAYRKGRTYNATLDAARAQQALGWTADIREAAIPAADGHMLATVDVTFTAADGRPLDGLDVAATFRRPTLDDMDADAAFKPLGNGRYRGTVDLAAAGQWHLHLTATAPHGDRFFVKKHMMLRADGDRG